MAIAPITGMLRKHLLTNLSIGIGGGVVAGYAFWYGVHLPNVRNRGVGVDGCRGRPTGSLGGWQWMNGLFVTFRLLVGSTVEMKTARPAAHGTALRWTKRDRGGGACSCVAPSAIPLGFSPATAAPTGPATPKTARNGAGLDDYRATPVCVEP
ncbi:hypothetical protein AAT19DRAFT_11769 [Rhodotorula toruloides]|uniref:Uncharacterized protein n=1 Tax=Rhodotorula toruloides TaxID=5286 RepID=A0A2S9ZVF4_RHOTO|nr:hypothetical protein AAT19DRAFT_11769 [Rhodotorula toruloides]